MEMAVSPSPTPTRFEGHTVALQTLGCKLNQAETSAVGKRLEERGFTRVPGDQAADVYVLNTCSVTENADKETALLIRRALRANPSAYVVVTGCYAQLQPEAVRSIPGVKLVLGSNEKFQIAERLPADLLTSETAVHRCETEALGGFETAWSLGDRTRAFLKVQDGCDYKCTYCTIPMARGASRSDTLQNVVKQAQKLAESGVREIVLTGVNTGDYGKGEFGDKKHEHTFLQLIEALDERVEVARMRISSVEPNLMSADLIRFIAESKRFVPHFHLPLQSGSDAVLARMKRRYRSGLYADRVREIRRVLPHACIGADVITGFPGETEAEFEQTVDFVREHALDYLHVFTYSSRPGTEAALLEQVPLAVRKERTTRLRAMGDRLALLSAERSRGKILDVLFEEGKDAEGAEWIEGYTPNYLRVSVPKGEAVPGRVVSVLLNEVSGPGKLRGQCIPSPILAL